MPVAGDPPVRLVQHERVQISGQPLALKAGARSVRHEDRDAEDLWRCLEIAAADGVTPHVFDGDTALQELRSAASSATDRKRSMYADR